MAELLVKDLCLGYGGKTIIQDFNYNFSIPGAYALMGESGSGKTTFLHTLAGLLQPQSGNVIGFERVKKAILFQEDRLLPWRTAEQNVAIVSDGDKARHWLALLELSDKLTSMPDKLSGGQRRRVSLARCAAFGGEVLLLDEPFSGLDERLKQRVAKCLAQSFKHIILSTHDIAEAKMLSANIIDISDYIK